MPKYTTADGISVECSEEQAAFLGYDKADAKKAPAKKAAPKKAADDGDNADT